MKFEDMLVKPATRRFVHEARRARDYSLYDFLHGYVYARWTYLYIGVGTGEHPLARKLGPWVKKLANLLRPRDMVADDEAPGEAQGNGANGRYTFADSYHGKVVCLEAARQLVTIQQDIDLPELEQVIPYRRATDIVLRNPDHLVALECPCRSGRLEPCMPLDVCLVVGEPFASFVTAHHPGRARWITPQEAVQILEEENARGHVHHAFFKDAMLGRFYAICNCCSCCCGAMKAQRNGTPMLTSSGYVARVDEALCIGCESCAAYCQFEALSVPDGFVSVDPQACMGCGVCVDKCDQEALSLARDASKGEPLEIVELMKAL